MERRLVHTIKNKLGAIKFASSVLNNKNIPSHKKDIIINNLKEAANEAIELFEIFSEIDKFKKSTLNKEKIYIVSLLQKLTNVNLNCEDKAIFFDKIWLEKAFNNILTQIKEYKIMLSFKDNQLKIIFLFCNEPIYIDLAKEIFSKIGIIKEDKGKIEIIL
ncbi:MAG: hypothetical protein ABGX26_01250 [Nautiliaceae bacterium]